MMNYSKLCPCCKEETVFYKIHRTFWERNFKYKEWDKLCCHACESIFFINKVHPQQHKIVLNTVLKSH